MEKDVREDYATEQKALFRANQLASLADVYFNTSTAVMKSVAASPLTFGQPFAGIAKALGVNAHDLITARLEATGKLPKGSTYYWMHRVEPLEMNDANESFDPASLEA